MALWAVQVTNDDGERRESVVYALPTRDDAVESAGRINDWAASDQALTISAEVKEWVGAPEDHAAEIEGLLTALAEQEDEDL